MCVVVVDIFLADKEKCRLSYKEFGILRYNNIDNKLIIINNRIEYNFLLQKRSLYYNMIGVVISMTPNI